MRLLNTTSYRLESFDGEFKPKYAILSHTWGNQEVLFEDIENYENLDWRRKSAWAKVEGSCRQASLDGYDYIWIDTCCINKSSSTELSEAINSMYQWYRSSAVCYAFLEDVQDLPDLSASRWLTRGWTLQELIAPETVLFYNKDWRLLGDRFELAPQISHQTKIGMDVLTRGHIVDGKSQRAHIIGRLGYCSSCGVFDRSLESILGRFCAAQKMTWASHRETTREEDVAYCLLGLFQVNMTPIYGEGSHAFWRLQEEITKRWNDQSILVWHIPPNDASLFFDGSSYASSLFAGHPNSFQLSLSHYVQQRWAPQSYVQKTTRMEMAPGKLALTALLCPISTVPSHEDKRIAILDCVMGDDLKSRPALLLKRLPGPEEVYHLLMRHVCCIVEPPGLMRPIDIRQAKMERISIVDDAHNASSDPYHYGLLHSQITKFNQRDSQYGIRDTFPRWIDNDSHTLPPSPLYAVVFEDMSSISFVLWRQIPEYRCSIMSLREVYNEAPFRIDYLKVECTVATVMRGLRCSSKFLTAFGASIFPRSRTSRLLGAPGPTQRLVSVNVTEGVPFLDARVCEVEVDISIPDDNEGEWSLALEDDPIISEAGGQR
ncbi:hypothetical protein Hte_001364 [Hypoxylon texense]